MLTPLDTVDGQKANTEVGQLRGKPPEDSPSQLIHQWMVRKTVRWRRSGQWFLTRHGHCPIHHLWKSAGREYR